MAKTEKAKVLQWEDLQDELMELVNKRNDEYNKVFNDARGATAKVMVDNFLRLNPKATIEEVKQHVEDRLNQAPDEFQRNLRVYANSNGIMFNLLQQLNNEVAEFKELFLAINQEKLEAWHRKQMRILKQKEEAEKKNSDVIKFKPTE